MVVRERPLAVEAVDHGRAKILSQLPQLIARDASMLREILQL